MLALTHRVSAGAIIVKDGNLLLVRHSHPERHDFWVAPGGGVESRESAQEASERETFEETGVIVKAKNLALIEELENDRQRICKLWFLAEYISGQPSAESVHCGYEDITEARFLSRTDISQLTVYPEFLKESRFWNCLSESFPIPLYLGLRTMKNY